MISSVAGLIHLAKCVSTLEEDATRSIYSVEPFEDTDVGVRCRRTNERTFVTRVRWDLLDGFLRINRGYKFVVNKQSGRNLNLPARCLDCYLYCLCSSHVS